MSKKTGTEFIRICMSMQHGTCFVLDQKYDSEPEFALLI